jgi:hypothetical protein
MKIKSVKSINPCISVIQTGYDIVKAHGGVLHVETIPVRAGTGGENAGTNITINIPTN